MYRLPDPLDVIPTAFYTDTVPVVYTIGVRETPEPTNVALLLTYVRLGRGQRSKAGVRYTYGPPKSSTQYSP